MNEYLSTILINLKSFNFSTYNFYLYLHNFVIYTIVHLKITYSI